jgi:hypothetical protein
MLERIFERRDELLLAGSVASLVFLGGLTVALAGGSSSSGSGVEELVNVTSENEVATADVGDSSFDVLLEDTPEAVFYIDKNRDGSADLTLDTTSNGSVNSLRTNITLDGEDYSIRGIYFDNASVSEDSYLSLSLES